MINTLYVIGIVGKPCLYFSFHQHDYNYLLKQNQPNQQVANS